MPPVTKKHQQLILLEPEQAALLDELAAETRIPKQVLLREAVTDLLTKYGKGEKLDSILGRRMRQSMADQIAASRHGVVKVPSNSRRSRRRDD
jgi:hypothetical protein